MLLEKILSNLEAEKHKVYILGDSGQMILTSAKHLQIGLHRSCSAP